ncbi:MAG: hypothetical protein Q4E24_10605 [bacterium]|nr:hypothetical protein [bacterium]
MEREKLLYEMAEEYHSGRTAQDVIAEYLGEEAEKKYTEVRDMIHSFHLCADSMMKRYEGTDLQLAVLSEIARVYPDDPSGQFALLSKLKYQNTLRGIELGNEKLREEAYDVEFLKETAKEAYEEEQSMAETATWTEVAELQAELIPFLVKDGKGIQDTLEENEADWSVVLETLRKDEAEAWEMKEDIEAMAAVMLLEEEPTISVEEAARAALYQSWLGHMQTWKELCLLDLALLEAGAVVELMGLTTGTALLNGIGGVLIGGSLAGFGILAAAALGAGASYAAEKLPPLLEKAKEHARPYVEQAAKLVKQTVARVIGFMANKVIRPAVRWVKGSAIPVIEEHVYYPLRRRLQAMLAWIGEKAEKVKAFVVRAAASPEWSGEETWDAERYAYETGYETEMEAEEMKTEEMETEETEEETETEETKAELEEEIEEETEGTEDGTEKETENEKVNLSFA